MKKKIYIVFSIVIVLIAAQISYSAVSPTINPVDIYTVASGAPERIAADSHGNVYITDNLNGLVRSFSNNGLHLNDLRLTGSPAGIEVDQAGKLYISDVINKNVGVYDSSGSLLFKLGSGDGEFILPNDIAVSATGKVYVTDSRANMVKVYSTSNGSSQGTFGLDILKFPTGITVDETAAEVFVLDYNNLYIRVYNLSGGLKRSIKGSGGGMMFSSKITAPLGIAVDTDRIYVSDAFHSVIAVYNRSTGAFFKYIGKYGSNTLEFRTPTDVVIDKDNKLFVTNSNNQRIDVLGIDTYRNLKISPSELSFSVYSKGSSATQTVSLSSDLNDTTWDATSSLSWVSVSASSGPTPSSVNVTVDPANVLPGNYNTDLEFITSSGMVSLLRMNVEVNKPILSVAPSSVNLIYQKNSQVFPSATLLISSIGAVLSWTGSTTGTWLGLDENTGSTPSSVVVESSSISNLDPGTYTASVGIDAGANVIGSPASVLVTLNIIEAGDIKVATNLDAASFTITGPQNFSGNGKFWTGANVQPGTYAISFDHVSGYARPYSRSFTVESGRTTEINAEYLEKNEPTHIIAGSGRKKEAVLSVLTLSGEKVFSVIPFENPQSVRIAAGDLDGSGSDKIVVTDYVRSIKVYSFEGTELATLTLPDFYSKADIAVGDIDNDGKADIIAGLVNKDTSGLEGKRVIKSFGYSDGQITEKAILFTESTKGDFSIGIGDINGDGMSEIMIADPNSIRAFIIDNTAGERFSQIWEVMTGLKKLIPRIAAGDINDDGIDEIGLSIMQTISKKTTIPEIRILNGSGELYGITIYPFGDLGYKNISSVCFGDIDGDGFDEIAAGTGPDKKNMPLIRFFESDGTFTGSSISNMGLEYDVNVSLGHFAE